MRPRASVVSGPLYPMSISLRFQRCDVAKWCTNHLLDVSAVERVASPGWESHWMRGRGWHRRISPMFPAESAVHI